MDMRGFADETEMNEYMIAQWNSRVGKKDEVEILGDFSLGTVEQTEELLRRLNGKKNLIVGNHDTFAERSRFDRSLFGWIHSYKEMHDDGRKVILSHYPMMCYNDQYHLNKENRPKTYMLYGHVHDTPDEKLIRRFVKETRETMRTVRGEDRESHIPCQMLNCFCMYSDYVPWTLDEWVDFTEKREKTLFQDDGNGADALLLT